MIDRKVHQGQKGMRRIFSFVASTRVN